MPIYKLTQICLEVVDYDYEVQANTREDALKSLEADNLSQIRTFHHESKVLSVRDTPKD